MCLIFFGRALFLSGCEGSVAVVCLHRHSQVTYCLNLSLFFFSAVRGERNVNDESVAAVFSVVVRIRNYYSMW